MAGQWKGHGEAVKRQDQGTLAAASPLLRSWQRVISDTPEKTAQSAPWKRSKRKRKGNSCNVETQRKAEKPRRCCENAAKGRERETVARSTCFPGAALPSSGTEEMT